MASCSWVCTFISKQQELLPGKLAVERTAGRLQSLHGEAAARCAAAASAAQLLVREGRGGGGPCGAGDALDVPGPWTLPFPQRPCP